MTWLAPAPTLKVALSHGRFTAEPGPGDWTDLTDRIVDEAPWIVDLCSRDTPRDAFRPGALAIVLDNTDRMLDPSNPDGWVYAPDGKGLPGCPVEFDLTFDGSTERRATMFLASPAWAGGGSRGSAERTVTLVCRDRLDWSGDLPDSPWACATMALHPDWWLPMDPPNAVLGDGSLVPDRSGATSSAADLTVVGMSLARPDSEPGAWTPWLKVPPQAYLTSAAADVMPDGDEIDLTGWCWWDCDATQTTGQSTRVLALVEPGGGDTRMEIVVDDDGEAQVTTYDAAGSVVDTGTVPRTFVSRWDAGSGPHFVWFRFTSGNNLRVSFGGDTIDLAATSVVYESDFIQGPSTDAICWWDEVTLFRRSLTDYELAGMVLPTGGFVGQWFGHTYTDRLAAWLEAAGITVTADWTNRMHVPVDDPEVSGFIGIGSPGIPANVADAWRQTVGDGGAVKSDREGFLVARDATALTSGDYDTQYVTPRQAFSDAATLPGGALRLGGARRSAVDEDSVINRVESQFWYVVDAGPPMDLQRMAFRPDSTDVLDGRTSFQQFGRRTHSESIDRYGWEQAGSRAQTLLERHAFPVVGFDVLTFDATGDDDLAAWLMTAEAEMPIDVSYEPDIGADRVTVEGLNIQGLRISGTTHTLRAVMKAFRS